MIKGQNSTEIQHCQLPKSNGLYAANFLGQTELSIFESKPIISSIFKILILI